MAAACNRGKDIVLKIKEWMLQIINAVAFSHSLGFIHCDLTACNILVTKHIGNNAAQADHIILCDL